MSPKVVASEGSSAHKRKLRIWMHAIVFALLASIFMSGYFAIGWLTGSAFEFAYDIEIDVDRRRNVAFAITRSVAVDQAKRLSAESVSVEFEESERTFAIHVRPERFAALLSDQISRSIGQLTIEVGLKLTENGRILVIFDDFSALWRRDLKLQLERSFDDARISVRVARVEGRLGQDFIKVFTDLDESKFRSIFVNSAATAPIAIYEVDRNRSRIAHAIAYEPPKGFVLYGRNTSRFLVRERPSLRIGNAISRTKDADSGSRMGGGSRLVRFLEPERSRLRKWIYDVRSTGYAGDKDWRVRCGEGDLVSFAIPGEVEYDLELPLSCVEALAAPRFIPVVEDIHIRRVR